MLIIMKGSSFLFWFVVNQCPHLRAMKPAEVQKQGKKELWNHKKTSDPFLPTEGNPLIESENKIVKI